MNENQKPVTERSSLRRLSKKPDSISMTCLLNKMTGMYSSLLQSRVCILVKALPQRSITHGETVCCAGITTDGEFKRLYPIKFRKLPNNVLFKRWDWVEFRYRPPTSDRRTESCHVMEETIRVKGIMRPSERTKVLSPLIVGSVTEASDDNRSLALIRPKNTKFYWKRKPETQIESERNIYRQAVSQGSLFDRQLKGLEPSPFEFRFKFEDDVGPHDYANGDWEAHAMFRKGKNRGQSDEETLDWMNTIFNDEYPEKGMVFCVGNVASRPQTWQLLGVLRVDNNDQQSLPF